MFGFYKFVLFLFLLVAVVFLWFFFLSSGQAPPHLPHLFLTSSTSSASFPYALLLFIAFFSPGFIQLVVMVCVFVSFSLVFVPLFVSFHHHFVGDCGVESHLLFLMRCLTDLLRFLVIHGDSW